MSETDFPGFQPSLIDFLDELADNNHRQWFQKNKTRYERDVLEPSLHFIRAFQPRLKNISGSFVASDRRVGGSLMRIYRDIRFAKDKTPYKTNVGIHFRHLLGKDVHAPGFYVHLAPGDCFLGVGVWCPPTATLRKIRQAMVDEETKWRRARDSKSFRRYFELSGERLKTAPRGFEKEHPLIEDLKRKSYIGLQLLEENQVFSKSFLDDVATSFAASRSLMRYLCEAIGIPF